jgi:hypothetical protein
LITAYAFLELVAGKMLHELSENGLANVHYPLSRVWVSHADVPQLYWG